MSFILENEKLIQLLTVAGANHLNKYGQANTSPEAVMNAQIAQKLLINLQRTIDPNNAPQKAVLGMMGQPPGTPIGLTTEYLKSFGDLLNWIATNKITWNGNRFAWSDAEKKADTAGALKIPEDAGMFDVKGVKRERNTETRQPIQSLMWVSKPALIDFITFLRDSDEARKNKVFQVMIGKLIAQANDSLEDNEQISKQPKQKPGTGPGEMPDDTQLTTFPDALSMERYYADGGKDLKFGDIKSSDAIINWVKRKGIGLEIAGRKGGPLGYNHPEFNYCVVLNVLYAKATYLLRQQAATPELKAKYTAFVNQLVKVGPTMQSPDGKACTVGTATQPGQPGADQPGGAAGAADKAKTQQMVHDVVSYMPLREENFDFTRVQSFFRAYEDLLSGTQSPQLNAVQTLGGHVATARQEIGPLLNAAMYNFTLSGDADMVVQWLRAPQYDKYVPFVQKMMAALEATKNAISMFYSSYVDPRSNSDRVGLTPDERQIVAGQFMGDSYYQRNRLDMNRWMNTSDRVTGLKK